MFKNLLLFSLLLSTGTLFGQSSFFTDFEEFEAGEYIAQESPYWDTESGDVTWGTGQDAQLVDTYSKSGNLSIKGTSENGPYVQGAFLNFGDVFFSGFLKLYFSIYVPEGKIAPLLIKEATIRGPLNYSMLNFEPDNTFGVRAITRGLTTFNNDEWIDVEFHCDLDNGITQVLMNGETVMTLKGKSSATFFSLKSYRSSLKGDSVTEYYIDDVGFDYTPSGTTFGTELMIGNSEGEFGAAGTEREISCKIINKGNDYNGAVTVNAIYNNQTITQNLGNISILANEEMTFTFDDKITISEGKNAMEINIVPEGDEDQTNNKLITPIVGKKAANNKVILIETSLNNATPYFPYTLVYLPEIKEQFGDKIAIIDVHHGGPLMSPIYSEWLNSQRYEFGNGLPSIYIDRVDFPEKNSWWFGRIVEYLDDEPSATFNTTLIPSETDPLKGTAEVEVTALKDIPTNFKLALILSENNIFQNKIGYEGANVYANPDFGLGEMGGYENKTNPIPAGDITYNNVARDVFPEPRGLPFDEAMATGEKKIFYFRYELNSEWNPNQMDLTAVLLNGEGSVDNAGKISFEKAGFFETDGNKEFEVNNDLHIFPNPTSGNAVIELKFDVATDIQVTIFDITGKSVVNNKYKNITGHQFLDLRNSNLNSGIYSVVLKTDKTISTQKLIVR